MTSLSRWLEATTAWHIRLLERKSRLERTDVLMLISDWVAVSVGGMNTTNCKMFTNVFHLSYKKW